MKLFFRFLSLLLLILLTLSCVSKKTLLRPTSVYTSSEISKIAEWRFQYDLEKEKLCRFFILDGVPYDHSSIDSILKRFDKRDVRMISFLKKSSENMLWYNQCDLIPLIQTSLTKQKRQYKKRVLKRILAQYLEFDKKVKIAGIYCDSCPLVYINSKPIIDSKVVSELIQLRLNEIEFIADYQSPQNIGLYGSKGKNGVVEIFLK